MTTFEAPGPGTWDLDRSHYDSAITPVTSHLMTEGSEAAYAKLFALLGVPAAGVQMREVHGFVYTRLKPFLGSDSTSTKTPPNWLIKLVFRLHPELRRREKVSAQMLEGGASSEVIAEWHASIKPRVSADNLAFQRVDTAALSDGELADHVGAVLAHNRATYEEHHRLHGYDLPPLAVFLVACRDWGIEPGESLAALGGASPATVGPRRQLAQIRAEVEKAGVSPADLDDVRAASPRAAELLDAYLERHGAVLFSSYDIDSPTLGERPEIVLMTILHAAEPEIELDGSAVAAALRSRVPAEGHAEFDRKLAEAQEAMDMRDDNGPITVEWPAGLMRLALLAAGERLTTAGRLHEGEHIFDVEPDELDALIRSGTGPSADVVAQRQGRRLAQRELDPPATLGPPPVEPPWEALPPAMRQSLDMTMAAMKALGMSDLDDRASLTGEGIGDESYEGVARLALTAEEAIAALEPGEILVTRATSPAFNLVLSLAGGLVTVDGGPMSHAAVLSRELGLPAVVGVRDCLEHVSNGDRLRIDADTGTVIVLD